MPTVNNFFLLPQHLHKQYERLGMTVLPIDFSFSNDYSLEKVIYRDSRMQLQSNYNKLVEKLNLSLKQSEADIIIEDSEIASTLLAEKNGIPRISLHRVNSWHSSSTKRRSNQKHSIEKVNKGEVFDPLTLLKPEKKLSQLYLKHFRNTYSESDADYLLNYRNPTTRLVPGIPSIEKLPDNVKDRDTIFYTGPLLIEDVPPAASVKQLNHFFDNNEHRKKIFIATGPEDQESIQETIIYLLEKDYAVVSLRMLVELEKYNEQFFHYSDLSVSYVCSKVDLIIHQCEGNICYYPLLHQKPVITIGTQYYDQEVVAERLQRLKLSKHIPCSTEGADYIQALDMCLELFEQGQLTDFDELKKITQEIEDTMLSFDMEEVIDATLSTSKA